jgi:hypothetical protein
LLNYLRNLFIWKLMREGTAHGAPTSSKSKLTGTLVKIYEYFKSCLVSKDLASQHKERSSDIQFKELHNFLSCHLFLCKVQYTPEPFYSSRDPS